MSQPVGRMFDVSPKYGFWLRSSPILCVGDLLHFILRVAAAYSQKPGHLRERINEEIAYRYRDEDWFKETNDVEKSALRRWVVILIGSIPCQTIKVMFMGQINFTKTLAMMFFIPMVFGELLIIKSEMICRYRDAKQAHRLPAFEDLKRVLYVIQAALFLAVPIKIVLFELFAPDEELDPLGIWEYRSCWSLIETSYTGAIIAYTTYFTAISASGLMNLTFPPPTGLLAPLVSLALKVLIEPIRVSFRASPNILSIYAYMFTILIYAAEMPIIMYVIFVYNGLTVTWNPSLTTAVWDVAILICPIVPLVLTLFILGGIRAGFFKIRSSVAYQRVSEMKLWRICGIPTDPDERSFLVMFLINLAITISGYAYLFDGSGTSIPSWIGVFG